MKFKIDFFFLEIISISVTFLLLFRVIIIIIIIIIFFSFVVFLSLIDTLLRFTIIKHKHRLKKNPSTPLFLSLLPSLPPSLSLPLLPSLPLSPSLHYHKPTFPIPPPFSLPAPFPKIKYIKYNRYRSSKESLPATSYVSLLYKS